MLNWRDPLNPAAGGAERVTLGYLSGLVKRGHQVDWYAFGFEEGLKEEVFEGIRIIRGGSTATAWFQALIWARKQSRYDLVIDQHHGIPWFAPWWCRTQCVSYIHEVLGPIWDSFYSRPWSWIGKHQEKFIHRLYRKCVFWTASEATSRQLKNHGIRTVHRIPYGVSIKALTHLPTKTLQTPLKLIVVSRLAPNKRIDHAIAALPSLRSRGVDAVLQIIGRGGEIDQLRKKTREMGIESQVEFTGSLNEKDKNRRLMDSHILLHTSIREGWGLNVIEANAMGTPAIAYPSEGLTESTIHRKTGLISEKETPESLATSIEELSRNPKEYQTLRINAWNRSREYHWDRVLPEACSWLETMASSC